MAAQFAMRPQVMTYPGSTVTAQWGSENRLVLDEFLTDTNGAVWSTWWTMGYRESPTENVTQFTGMGDWPLQGVSTPLDHAFSRNPFIPKIRFQQNTGPNISRNYT
jgi:hypothetical protein